MRPLLHFTPERGWMNDPNGLIERDGVHHLFFQHHPDDITFGRMCWGHATSRDLLTWVEHGSVLVPGGPGPDGAPVRYDHDGVWSGCAVAVDDGVLFLYTAREGAASLPCVAVAHDAQLQVLTRHRANPVIATLPTERTVTDFRDHVVWRHAGLWHQLVGAGSVEGRGGVFAYSSPDLIDWTYEGITLEAVEHDLPGDVWECPDLLLAPLTEPGRAVLIVSLIGAPMGDRIQPVIWIGGAWQHGGDGPRLVPDAWGLLDVGTRFYAPQSYLTADGRRLMFGWLREQLEPLDDEHAVTGAPARERVGVMSVPRELTVVGGRPHQVPAAEVDAARVGEPVVRRRLAAVEELSLGSGLDSQLGHCFELELEVDGALGGAGVVLTLTGPSGASFVVDFEELLREPSWWARDGASWVAQPQTASKARVLFDCGVVELFLDNGTAAAWTPVHLPQVATVTVALSESVTASVTVWALRPSGSAA